MATFTEMVALCMARIDNRNDRVEPYVKAAIVRALRDLAPQRFWFMEASTSFVTTAGQLEYTAGYADFPVDISQILALYIDTTSLATSRDLLTGPYGIAELRQATFSSVATAGRPQHWGWHARKLVLAPGVGQEYTLKLDYVKDATRDQTTGNAITEDDTTTTNPLFTEGQSVLLNHVLVDVHGGLLKDQDAAGGAQILRDAALRSANAAQATLGSRGGQAGWHL